MNNTPKFWTRLFEWLCDDSFFEELQGDLEERYFINQEKFGAQKAKAAYRKEVLKMVRPSVLKLKNKLPGLFNVSLFRIHLILSLRNLKRNKVYSTINILGLGAALSVCLLIVNMVLTGLLEDHQHPENDRFYRITTTQTYSNGVKNRSATNPKPLERILKSELPEIELMALVDFGPNFKFDWGNAGFETNSILVDPTFFKLFDFKVLEGNPNNLFEDLNSIVITSEVAEQIFSDESAIGKTTLDGKVVKAVIENPKAVSHMDFQTIASRDINKLSDFKDKSSPADWEAFDGYFIYIRANDQFKKSEIDLKLREISNRVNSFDNIGDRSFLFSSQRVRDVTFGDFFMFDFGMVVNRNWLYTMLILGAIILGVAIFNYTNLAVARGIQRTKEIGIRKINGSTEFQIVSQFLTETVLLAILAFGIGLVSYNLFASTFVSTLEGVSGIFTESLSPKLILWFLFFTVLIGLIAGILPALHFARIKPLDAIKSKLLGNRLSVPKLRKVLTGIQLTISMLSILLMTIGNDVYKQVLSSDLGFDYESVVTFNTYEVDTEILLNSLSKISTIEEISRSDFTPGVEHNGLMKAFMGKTIDTVPIYVGTANYAFGNLYEPKMLRGELPQTLEKTSDHILVNPLFLQRLNIPLDSALGQKIYLKSSGGQSVQTKYIAGVMDSFVRNAMESYGVPFVIELSEENEELNTISLKIDFENLSTTLDQVNKIYSDLSTKSTFEPKFLDDQIENSYYELLGIIKTIWFLGIVIILIAILGQLGITLYDAESRTKEIGIRKVLGAGPIHLLKLLLGGTLKTLLIALVISTPLAFLFIGNGIMVNISVQTHISIFAAIEGFLGLSTLVIGVILLQTLRTARLNPSESLRNE
ncbi:FtsX-like permease family protein [Roseivirga misakiensis]|uniref:ABC3 transporter permease protein domain-containing protein n=1 Tax=Roseivirga misakiensis TaxID=1563681 RepID=A0A1E5SKA8_9BACT|nr:FtsX-like permease family protein [Roseivirga misakiensis]OEJ99548.1 hypothetical protein BFP71_08190 [Roseivirga misakiensis]